MKKVLISLLIILLLVLACFSIIKGIDFLGIKSINSIKQASAGLDNDFNKATELSSKTYPSEVEGLEEAIKKLKISKQDYENKTVNISGDNSIGSVEVKTYKIHYLWTILGNYRKDRNVQSLSLNLKSTQAQNVYDLDFTLRGSYTSITDFIYDIENDEELNFEIKNFEISSQLTDTSSEQSNTSANTDNSTNTDNKENTNSNNVLDNSQNNGNNNESNSNKTNTNNSQNTTKTDGVLLEAKFTVENIGITLD